MILYYWILLKLALQRSPVVSMIVRVISSPLVKKKRAARAGINVPLATISDRAAIEFAISERMAVFHIVYNNVAN